MNEAENKLTPEARSRSAEEMVQSEYGRRVAAILKADGTIQVFQHTVTKDFVERLETSGIDAIVSNVVFELRSRGQFQAWNLLFDGFTDDMREVYEIPSIRRWSAAVYEKVPFVPLLLSEETMPIFIWSLIDLSVLSRNAETTRIRTQLPDLLKLIVQIENSARTFFANCGIADPTDMAGKLAAQLSRVAIPNR